jgi:hypothetical protein
MSLRRRFPARRFVRWSSVILLGLILYLTLKRNPAIQEVRWMPGNYSEFFDLHDNWKNFTGFGVLAMTVYLGWPPNPAPRWQRLTWEAGLTGLCCGIVFSMEFLQLYIPTRHCDWKDMVWGAAGAILAWVPARALRGAARLASIDL